MHLRFVSRCSFSLAVCTPLFAADVTFEKDIRPADADTAEPSVIVIYADDLGYGDVQSYHPGRGGSTPDWQLSDLVADYGQQTNVAARHPEVVGEPTASFGQWWSECLPLIVNEKVLWPKLNPFPVWYCEEFSGGPTAADFQRMDPACARPAPAAGKKEGMAK